MGMSHKQKAIALAVETYLINKGNKLNDPLIGPKRYWSLLIIIEEHRKVDL